MRRIPFVIAIGSTLCLSAPASHALSFGRVDNSTVLGQPLEFSAVVSAAGSDDTVDGECLAAEVFAGDNKLPAPLVRVRIDSNTDGRQANVRVTTTIRIDEPVVTVNLMIGCPVKLSQRFVTFVDPPVIALPRAVADASPPNRTPAEPSPDAPPTTASPAEPKPEIADRKPKPDVARVPRAQVAARPPKRPPSTVVAAAATRPRSSGTAAAGAASAAPSSAQSASGPSRLTLESAPAASAAPISAAASAILAAELESYAQELAVERQRMKALEENVERMRRENDATRSSLAKVQAQLHDADAAKGPANWFYGLIALLVAIIAGLLWRQAKLKREAAWWAESQAPANALPPVDVAEPAIGDEAPLEAPFVPVGSLRDKSADDEITIAQVAPIASGPLPMRDAPPARPRGQVTPFDTQPMPPGTFQRPTDAGLEPPRELSVEELIDIEQQAEFFVVLGQDDAAIDLLMGLVRSSGGQTPMPFLKLLEIYRRQGDRDAYDRIRERFNQRFNGMAPPLDIDPAFGLDLTGYPDVLGRLQAAWAQPQQVVTMIDRLLPKSSLVGVDTLFDLEAFAELLFLARIARDLDELETGMQGVDFLLPLDTDPLLEGPATMSLHAPYEAHLPMIDLTLDLDLEPLESVEPPSSRH